jgi:hypothetical protein
MSEEVVYMVKLSESAWPQGRRVRFRRSAVRFGFERGYVLADPPAEEPPAVDRVGMPKGCGARPAGIAGPKYVRWAR